MHQASQTIGTIAAALAKAQAELTNPEKTLTATIRRSNGRGNGATFRYAPLASGLDIIRKCLGRYEIAVVQTTQIDQDSQFIRLTTVLVHASGEWMASEWPICPIADSAEPHRMGAALTYARRYALFALVGIAGEDDLDAPDLAMTEPAQPDRANAAADRSGATPPGVETHHGAARGAAPRPAIARLAPAESARQRDQLRDEMAKLATHDALTAWAERGLAAKNTLLDADARVIEEAFAAKLAAWPPAPAPVELAQRDQPYGKAERVATYSDPNGAARVVEKRQRKRDRAHRDFVAAQPCLVCGRQPSDAHHLRFAEPRALGRKVSDEFTVPLCRTHHRELHRASDEGKWWSDLKLDPLAIAARLWNDTRRHA